MIIGLSGFAGSGKDTVADALVEERNFVKVSMADGLKRMCRDTYDFSDEQLWGASEQRSKPDKRYPREDHIMEVGLQPDPVCVVCGAKLSEKKQCYLTPRYALQQLGTEWGRNCYPGTWVEYTLRVVKSLLGSFPGGDVMHCPAYDPRRGVSDRNTVPGYTGAVIPDCRFLNEFRAIERVGGKLVRIKRAGFDEPAWNHPSETEQLQYKDEDFSFVLHNTGSLSDLRSSAFDLPDDLVSIH